MENYKSICWKGHLYLFPSHLIIIASRESLTPYRIPVIFAAISDWITTLPQYPTQDQHQDMAGNSGDVEDLEKADYLEPISPSSPSISSDDSSSTITRLSLSRQRTIPLTDYDLNDKTVLERHRTAASVYENTVGGRPQKPRAPSLFSRITSRLPEEEWPEFGGGKGE